MKLLGTLLIAFGSFFLLAAALVVLAPGLRVGMAAAPLADRAPGHEVPRGRGKP